MAKVAITGFGGIIPRLNPAMLPNNAAQVASNCVLWHGDLRPLKNPLQVVTPSSIGGTIKSIYRIGMSISSESQYWMTWTSDVDVVRGLVADDTSERTYFTGDGIPKATNLQMATQSGTSYPVNSFMLGVPAPIIAPVCTPSSTTAPVKTRVYVYTYVNSWGEEGAISPPSSLTVSESGTVDMVLVNPSTGSYDITGKRIYRSEETATGGAIYRFVSEISGAQTDYTDNVISANLGEELTTIDFLPPPATLSGLVALPNGILAGFTGYDIYFCEPFLPYAFPPKYSLTVDYPIVGLGVFGSSLLVMTKGSPYLVNGVHPDSMSMEKIELDQACVSKRSIVSIGGGVIYASPDGLVLVGAGGSRVLTQGLYTREEWQALNPSTIDGYYHDGKYIASFAGGGGFILNSMEDASLTLFDDTITAGHVDLINDGMYLCIGGAIKRFNAGTDKTLTWKSKKFQVLAKPAPACGRVDADTYPITFKLYADGVLKFTKTVNDEHAFRMPSGYRPREIEIEVNGTSRVRLVSISDSVEEMSRD